MFLMRYIDKKKRKVSQVPDLFVPIENKLKRIFSIYPLIFSFLSFFHTEPLDEKSDLSHFQPLTRMLSRRNIIGFTIK